MVSCSARILVASCLVLAWVLGAPISAQTPAGQTQVPKVKAGRAVPIVSVEGRDNYVAYCAVCHGLDGTGNGPAAPAMKKPVADLTTVAKRHGGKFNPIDVEYIIKGTGKTETPAHGVEEMPIWGDVFRHDEKGVGVLRIRNLVKYIESIQR